MITLNYSCDYAECKCGGETPQGVGGKLPEGWVWIQNVLLCPTHRDALIAAVPLLRKNFTSAASR